jgi:hypothetical protein
MEKRSCHRIRDLVALTAIQGLSQNEIGCARISVMAMSKSAPFKGRIQKRKTNYLQIIISSLQRTAGPYTQVPCMDGARGARGGDLMFPRIVRVQPCIRPLNAAVLAAGSDVIR